MNSEIQLFKDEMEEKYGCRAQQKSPPHITIMPPFGWNAQNEEDLIMVLDEIAIKTFAFPAELKDFGFFQPKVVYINVTRSPRFLELHQRTGKLMNEKLQIIRPGFFENPFVPHVTIAHRDIKPDDFKKAKAEFERRHYEKSFTVNILSLLRHNGKFWDVAYISEIRLDKSLD